jgi:hypothetical protein
LKYREYVCVPSASHLQHPVNAYTVYIIYREKSPKN